MVYVIYEGTCHISNFICTLNIKVVPSFFEGRLAQSSISVLKEKMKWRII